jgi:hypothetical protein
LFKPPSDERGLPRTLMVALLRQAYLMVTIQKLT